METGTVPVFSSFPIFYRLSLALVRFLTFKRYEVKGNLIT
jgi:hypothetical protein